MDGDRREITFSPQIGLNSLARRAALVHGFFGRLDVFGERRC